MGITWRTNVEWGNLFDRLERDIESGIREGADDLASGMKATARTRIREDDALFSGRLLAAFHHNIAHLNGDTILVVRNEAPYAHYVEYGVRGTKGGRGTGGQYTARKPPLDALIPWVEAKLQNWDLDVSTSRLVPRTD